jgi:hypothetical protein
MKVHLQVSDAHLQNRSHFMLGQDSVGVRLLDGDLLEGDLLMPGVNVPRS